jgi:competence protein CoiA
MKFALANGQRREAEPNLSGQCPGCGKPMISRCGDVPLWHWAHKGRLLCDPWWENETDWHRAWKNQFPADWQEVVHHHAETGERHIADVKTRDGWVLEFQHSHIEPDERRSRETYYQTLIWVVDGRRRKRDVAQFLSAWSKGTSRDGLWDKRRISSPEGALLRDWSESRAHVFFDFGEEQSLWWLFPGSDETRAYVRHISRAQFVRIHLEKGLNEIDSLVENFNAFIGGHETPLPTPRPQRLMDLAQRSSSVPIVRRSARL